ncbi:MAG: Gfo/Idh/MocA family protein [Chitinophagaceae bacterium]
MLGRKLRMGMIGGGPGSFIGAVHRMAANLDGEMEWVCGAFSSDAEKSRQTGRQLYLDPSRVYGSYREMIRAEAALPAGERMDIVSIVTPNHLHFEPARLALENGFHVVLDKPATFSLAEARLLRECLDQTGLLFCLTHTYTGYPMVKEARRQVLSGKFGAIRKIYVEYPQGWLSSFLEGSDQKQATWRTDPAKSGIAGCMGDIGTHAFNLAEYVTGLRVEKICAAVNIMVPGRKLDDDGAALLQFGQGASGVLFATQVAAGEENNIRIRVYGEKGGLEWKQEDANSLLVKWPDRPTEIWRTGTGYVSASAAQNTRTPAGHPEGYLEAFANHYRNFACCVKARISGTEPQPEWLDFPGIEDGVRGMLFIEKVIESGASKEKWVSLD